MFLAPGTRLGPYEVVEPLGAGGMAEVYRARDSRLDRDVALKLLPPHGDPGRFRAEAKAVAALSHPNIVGIFDVGENYLVEELVDGAPIPAPAASMRALADIAVQIADGLAAAHEAGFIHRDLKPANILLSRQGQVKILDFGLAKRVREEAADAGDALTATRSGLLLGTAAYMSPEQARGDTVDFRSDQFAFGLVLYEMATGQRAFQRATAPETLTAILRDNPAPLPASVPAALRSIIERCLAKAPADRYASTRTLFAELSRFRDEMTGVGMAGAAPAARRSKAWIVAACAAGLAVVATGLWVATHARTASSERAQRILPLITDPGNKASPAFSADGRWIAYVWKPDDDEGGIFSRSVAAGAAPQRLTRGGSHPAWSPDGRWIAFYRDAPAHGSISIVGANGGSERIVTEVAKMSPAIGGAMAWSADGKWIVAPDQPSSAGPFELTAISIETGEKRRVTNPPPSVLGDGAPCISPDGRTFAFVRVAAFGVSDIYVQPAAAPSNAPSVPKPVTNTGWAIRGLVWAGDSSHVLFSADHDGAGRLWKAAVAKPGPPVAVDWAPAVGHDLAISAKDGRLAYIQDIADVDVYRQEIPRPGEKATAPTRLADSSWTDFNARISPDGNKIAFSSNRTGAWEIWTADADGRHPAQLTHFGGPETGTARWSPDGRRIAFDTRARGNADIYVVDASGGEPTPLTSGRDNSVAPSWSHDGKWIYFASNRLGQYQLWKMPAAGGRAIQLTRGGAVSGLESPDGKFVYFARSYTAPTSLWRVPSDGGDEAQILDTLPQALTYDVRDEGVYILKRATKEDPRRLLELYSFATRQLAPVVELDRGIAVGLSVSPDGRWFAFAGPGKSPRATDIMVIENFR